MRFCVDAGVFVGSDWPFHDHVGDQLERNESVKFSTRNDYWIRQVAVRDSPDYVNPSSWLFLVSK